MKQWEKEHGAGYDVPAIVQYLVDRKVLEDISWHNDTAPSFAIADPEKEDFGIRLWVDHPIKSMRELEGQRFGVQLGMFSSESEDEISTDELEEALTKLFEYAKNPRFAGTSIRKQKWWDDELEPFELTAEFLSDYSRR